MTALLQGEWLFWEVKKVRVKKRGAARYMPIRMQIKSEERDRLSLTVNFKAPWTVS
jgi:hypothetical protein